MKELSIEEKAKSYDEAIKYAHYLINERCKEGSCGSFHRLDLERMFPELAESEDERIRKWLIGYFNQYIIDGMPQVFGNGLNVKDVIAWLEKQGEITKEWSEMKFNNIQKELQEMVDLKQKTEQGEQKPYGQREECTDCQFNYAGECKGFCAMKRSEQKPTNIDLDTLVIKLEETIGTSPHSRETIKEFFQEAIQKYLNALQEANKKIGELVEENYYLKEKPGEQKSTVIIPKFRIGDEIKTDNEESLTITKIDEKGYWSGDLFICDFDEEVSWDLIKQNPAWSEEDNRILSTLTKYLKEHGGGIDGWECSFLSKWLESLRPQNRWKPSDEQMEAVKEAACYSSVFSKKTIDNLISLSKQLKKLK